MSTNENRIEKEKEELIRLNIEISKAENEGETDFLKTVLADDLIFRKANGKVVNKSEYLRDLIGPDNAYERFIPEDIMADVYDDIAVVSFLVRAKGQRGMKGFGTTHVFHIVKSGVKGLNNILQLN